MLPYFEKLRQNRVSRLLAYVAGSLLDFLYPRACVLCGRSIESGLFCSVCMKNITAQRAVTMFSGKEDFVNLCDTPCFDQCFSGWNYSKEIKEIIGLMKYKGYTALCEYAGAMLGESLQKELRSSEIIMPVPLHTRRKRERTYNQSWYIAKGVTIHNPHLTLLKCIRRVRYTEPQAMLTGRDRQNNVRDAFTAGKPDCISGRNIVLVDDVVTTGATIQNCSGVLKAAGADKVTCISIARPYK